ncbi:RhoGAP-domain-containing protein [Exidia glandulosa HHB12029]|uniref:RhoGAP-domain-containing protein n=1 Tax=Exidia glandulosa HHB12029 TaxID=1314781 RepID=A0A166ALI6_EXIGL|nr:RhoGAP-domain-containing protein [Exidia glandulosa HHB12029]
MSDTHGHSLAPHGQQPRRNNSGDSADSGHSHSYSHYPPSSSSHGHGNDQLGPGRRSKPPSRSSTMDQNQGSQSGHYARSNDDHYALNNGRSSSPAASDNDHNSPLSPPAPSFLSAGSSRPTTPSLASGRSGPPSSHSDDSLYTGGTSLHSSTTGTAANAAGGGGLVCAKCHLPMTGQFVRALNTVFHLDCFRCQDCDIVVASKFFPIEGPDGQQHPLCERDYFRRLNLICGKCGQALRGSYITACNKKFHVEHFTCSVCPTVFGPHDSYYEHDDNVYCHFHYSTRFATKCVGCTSAILKQFVEINRNMRDECWHPECYMIHKFWNVKIATRRPSSPVSLPSDSISGLIDAAGPPHYQEEEEQETPTSLREKQAKMEHQVYRVWTVLSAFEESSAACISDMLRQVSGGQYLEAIRQAEKFILHVEVLFATIDDLEAHFAAHNAKGMSHVREARMLCRKTVDLFTLLSRTQDSTNQRKVGMTQELLSLVTGLAHYLKILIRIALTGALKLERDYGNSAAMEGFLDKLHRLGQTGGSPSVKRLLPPSQQGDPTSRPTQVNDGTQGVIFGYKSLAPENAGESPFGRDHMVAQMKTPSDLCMACKVTVEEDCVRLGTYMRWHSHCVRCKSCDKVAAPLPTKEKPAPSSNEDGEKPKEGKTASSLTRRPPANVIEFVFEAEGWSGDGPPPLTAGDANLSAVFCTQHGHAGCNAGFLAVSRLEQYAFLLNVALRRLYLLLKRRGVMPSSPVMEQEDRERRLSSASHDSYRDSADIMRLKTVHLDRKLSSTAQRPKRSTIVESPAGKIATPTDIAHAQKHQHHHHERPAIQQAPSTASSVPTVRQPQPRTALQQLQPPSATSSRPSIPSSDSSSTLTLPSTESAGSQQVLRPPFARNNTQVCIVDDGPDSPRPGEEDEPDRTSIEEGITLADIPQLIEVEQARVEQRSLPRQGGNPYIADLSPLELQIVKHSALITLYKSGLREQFDLDEVLELIDVRRNNIWSKLFKGGGQKPKKKGVFAVPLEYLVEREGVDSMLGASRTAVQIPSFIDDVISAMKQMDMSVEGIFRRNGNIRRLNDLVHNIDRDPSSVDLSQDNPVQLAALMKKFFRDLPDPLLTFKLHKLFCATQTLPNEADRKKYLHLITLLLPKPHRDTMEVLFVFLKWVASFAHVDEETGSKMDLPNLATVICPNILYSKGPVERDDQFLAIRCITQLLEQQDEFYVVPDDFMPILGDQEYFSNSLDLPRKDFMKKCEMYIKLKSAKDKPRGINLPPSSSSGTPIGTPGIGSPAEDSRLVAQRSDPQMSRGRQLEPLRPPPPIRDRQTGSLERGDQRPAPLDYAGTAKGQMQGMPQSYSHPGHPATVMGQSSMQMPPMSPRKAPGDMSWQMQQQMQQMQQMQQVQQQQLMQRNGQNSQPMPLRMPPPSSQMQSGPPTPTVARSRPLSWIRNGDQPPNLNGQLSPVTTTPAGNYQRQ